MASIKELKKEINSVLGDIIEAVYVWEAATENNNSKEGNAIIDEAIEVFDDLVAKINDRSVENRKAHLKVVDRELEEKANQLIEKVNKLS